MCKQASVVNYFSHTLKNSYIIVIMKTGKWNNTKYWFTVKM